MPPLCNLSLGTKRMGVGGAYTRDATISLAIMPSLPVKHDLIVGGGWGQAQDVAERKAGDVPNARLTSSALKGEEAGRFSEVAGVSIIDAGGPCSR